MLELKNKNKKNISIIGLMGSGKSIVGKEISIIFGLKYYDSDAEIEKKMGKTINQIFEENGEKYFRYIEESVCLRLLNKKNSVISLGGGSVLNKKIRDTIKKNSYSIYLNVKIEELVKRLKNTKKRPLLKNVDIKKKIEEIFINRKKYYNKADLIIENSLKKNDTINIIKENIKYK